MTTVVTKATGGTAKPVGVLYIEPDRQVPDAGAGTALEQTGLQPAFTADLLSACLAHERCGLHLYRSVAARTTLDGLRQQYEHFGRETAEHVRLLEELITASGGDPGYVSPAARATEKAASGLVESTYLLGGSVDSLTAETSMLEAVVLAETKDRANWELLAQLADAMGDSEIRTRLDAVTAEVLLQEQEHESWARQTLNAILFAAATGGALPPSTGDDEVIDLTQLDREELVELAQELDIPGGSRMSKDELVSAMAERNGGTR